MKVKDDYERVGVPMLPAVAGNKVVARQIVAYSWAMVRSRCCSAAGLHRLVLYVVAVLCGAFWLKEAHGLQPAPSPGSPAPSSRRCGCSTGRSPMSRCFSSPSPWTPSSLVPVVPPPLPRAEWAPPPPNRLTTGSMRAWQTPSRRTSRWRRRPTRRRRGPASGPAGARPGSPRRSAPSPTRTRQRRGAARPHRPWPHPHRPRRRQRRVGNLVADSFGSAKDAVEAAGVALQDDFDGDLAAKVAPALRVVPDGRHPGRRPGQQLRPPPAGPGAARRGARGTAPDT